MGAVVDVGSEEWAKRMLVGGRLRAEQTPDAATV
jgi:hypothetical protein